MDVSRHLSLSTKQGPRHAAGPRRYRWWRGPVLPLLVGNVVLAAAVALDLWMVTHGRG